jgi:hypothetical protein
MTQAAIEMLTEEIAREREFQTTDEWDGDTDIVPVLEEMIERIQLGTAPTTFEEVEEWSFKIYDATADQMGGDDDLAVGIAEGLMEALNIKYKETDHSN